jgi:hypothetical protein
MVVVVVVVVMMMMMFRFSPVLNWLEPSWYYATPIEPRSKKSKSR